MNVDYAFLAGAAEVGADGRLYLMGADFNQIYGPFPLTVPSLALVVKIIFRSEECGKKYHLSVRFYQPDGQRMDPRVEQDFTPAVRSPDKTGLFTIVLALHGVVFPIAGVYNISILLDSQEVKAFHLFAEEVLKPERTAVSVA